MHHDKNNAVEFTTKINFFLYDMSAAIVFAVIVILGERNALFCVDGMQQSYFFTFSIPSVKAISFTISPVQLDNFNFLSTSEAQINSFFSL